MEKAINARRSMARALWKYVQGSLKRLSVPIKNVLTVNAIYWDLIKKELEAMSGFVDDVTLLVPFYLAAAKLNDLQFARLIISKVDASSKSKVLQFVTTKLTSHNNRCVLHFAP